MRRYKKEENILNEKQVPISSFLEAYNQNIPTGFPRASVAVLKKFQSTHPTLFKHGNMWSIDLHRKRIIDWLSVYRDIA
ncbi:MAG: hypothetical protein UU22_C0045G0002 [Parcubacteria group bacterium GW2011_GWA2_40_8]|uniref:Uncharacterized protein n=1 Tax=Candidatus Terrybacteria bacterium RIFCSPLOWO2_01_FULL_40_23 TaxID=1802366 RepID=A0A1G2PX47_9BACT|nr:MAG: hypothetical protein UT82_C0012G0012 [Parcubacteria group bacterium GW2011_GWB1_40_14]KKR77380.1 MAG: hypothetical protein UU22_C0045G0002 [Parcubacteria group bacterium GW2011_GWA2_40_8]OHA52890.1 MAG: hypothetical protein A3A97_04295 [Candidatus Terrybacteria bacterium RIFCSPLOWO2_01_FULL_40_23]